jgi:ABC-2 type transport system ATP-binding protein
MIIVEHLFKTFGATVAVNDLSLRVRRGEIVGLVGPDGAGKTTTIRLLCGALKPSSVDGQISRLEIGGINLLKHPEMARGALGYLPQRFSMYEDLTVLENLRFFAEVRGLQPAAWREHCMEILAFVGLAEFIHRRAGQLSGGMKQKLGLAAALVHQPKVLLLDEPTTGVDPVTRQDFWQLIIRLVAEELVAVLVSTPYMDEAARCQRVGFMMQGRILIEGTPEVLRESLAGQVVELRGHPLRRLRELAHRDPAILDVHMFGDRIHLRVAPDQADAVISRLETAVQSNGLVLTRLRSIQPQLEDVFMSLVDSA